jgi:hypothetical protein
MALALFSGSCHFLCIAWVSTLVRFLVSTYSAPLPTTMYLQFDKLSAHELVCIFHVSGVCSFSLFFFFSLGRPNVMGHE